MRQILFAMFAISAGFVVAGITASTYRLIGAKAETVGGQVARALVMVIAGPLVLFETVVRALREERWCRMSIWLACIGVAYWSLVTGLFMLDLLNHWPKAQ